MLHFSACTQNNHAVTRASDQDGMSGSLTLPCNVQIIDTMQHACKMNPTSVLVDIGAGDNRWGGHQCLGCILGCCGPVVTNKPIHTTGQHAHALVTCVCMQGPPFGSPFRLPDHCFRCGGQSPTMQRRTRFLQPGHQGHGQR